MAKKTEPVKVTEENKEEVTDLLLVKIEQLTAQIIAYEEKLLIFKTEFDKLIAVGKKLNGIATTADNILSLDLKKHYGFSGENMFYIGTGSGRIYTKPVNDKIVNLIANLGNLEEMEVRELNTYFMK